METKAQRIAIVTDGACDQNETQALENGLHIVPIPLVFPDGTQSDSNQFSIADFWKALLADYTTLPKTSKPSPFDFERKLTELAQEGYEAAVILTLSTGMSSTYESALSAAETALIPVKVIDSRSVSWGLGMLCEAAGRAIAAGLDLEEIAAYVEAVRSTCRIYFVVDTLEYLVRGGRAGRAAGLLAATLKIKPLLQVQQDGIIEATKKCRGRKKAFEKLAKIVAHETHGKDKVRYILLQTDKPADAEELHATLQATSFKAEFLGTRQVGIVVGIYCGPGTAALLYWEDLDPADFRRSIAPSVQS